MANKKKIYFDTFDHPTLLHTQKEVVAMNNHFQGLTGYGVLCLLMEMCGRNLDGKIPFSPVDRKVMAAMINVPEDVFEKIVKYMDVVNLISIGEESVSVNLIDKYIIRKRIRRESVRVAVAQKREKIARKRGLNVNAKESEAQKRRRIWREFDEILILTDRIVNDAHLKYPLHGDVRVYFKHFITFIKTGYAKYHGKITHDNYIMNFYMYMNSYKLPLVEALDSEQKRKAGPKGILPDPIKFGFDKT